MDAERVDELEERYGEATKAELLLAEESLLRDYVRLGHRLDQIGEEKKKLDDIAHDLNRASNRALGELHFVQREREFRLRREIELEEA